jgi:hypothetical protein
LAGRDFLLIAEAVAPLGDGVSAVGASGLSRALVALGHRATVLTLATVEVAGRVPGLARRLRTVSAAVGGQTRELVLYEGRSALSDAQLLVLASPAAPSRAEAVAILAGATRTLAVDKLIAPEVAIGWGEASAAALSATSATTRLFVLPTGRTGAPLAAQESEILGPLLLGDDSAAHSLVALGCLGAHAIVAPSPTAARATESDPGLASRPSDEPFVSVRFGCDDPPNDPATDPALPVPFSLATLSHKAECRRALARRCSLAVGPRTLLLTTGPLTRDASEAILGAIERLAAFDVVAVIVPRGEPEAIERARLLALRQPGRVALLPGADPADERFARGAADAILLGDDHDRIGRSAGLALLYGTLPIAPDVGANHDYLVDYDPASRTGQAILYSADTPFEIESGVRRALTLRADGDVWAPLVKSLMESAPRWAATATALTEIVDETIASGP